MSERGFRNTSHLFVRPQAVEAETLTAVEGGVMSGLVTVKTLVASNLVVMLESYRAKGVIDPSHKHDDHETVCFLKSGKLKLVIGEESFIAEPGDVWFHPVGVMHHAEALEESVQVEVKVPPRKTWISPDD
jgi:quercetin dioxygenase-like cupin family protein